MTSDGRIVLNSRHHAGPRSLKVEPRIFGIGVDWRESDSDWSILGFQELYLHANGTEDLEKPVLREKFRVAGSVCSRPLDHTTHKTRSALERGSDGSNDEVLTLNSDITTYKYLGFI